MFCCPSAVSQSMFNLFLALFNKFIEALILGQIE
jgi:hypothetical protein